MSTTETSKDDLKVKLTMVRTAWPHVLATAPPFKPGDKPRYTTSLIVTEEPDIARVKHAMVVAARGQWKDRWKDVLREAKQTKAVCFLDGNKKRNKKGELYPDFENAWVLSAARQEKKGQPEVRTQYREDGELRPVLNDKGELVGALNESGREPLGTVIYSGCYVNAFVSLWAQPAEAHGTARINCTIDGIQFAADGDPIGAGVNKQETGKFFESNYQDLPDNSNLKGYDDGGDGEPDDDDDDFDI